jgi:hypothetical protein
MGMEDRDYYREWWAEKQGYTEKSKIRLPAKRSTDEPLTYKRGVKNVVICTASLWSLFAVLRLV